MSELTTGISQDRKKLVKNNRSPELEVILGWNKVL
jgi:hypothetical protein